MKDDLDTYEQSALSRLSLNVLNDSGKTADEKNLPNGQVTFTDLLSHSSVTNCLKNKFTNLQFVSEEKDSFNDEEFQIIKEEFNVENKSPNISFIPNDKNFMTVPLSSVAAWIEPLDATKKFCRGSYSICNDHVMCYNTKKPTIGILYAPFTDKLAWPGVDHSQIKRDENSLLETHKPNVVEIIVSRSYADEMYYILKSIYHDKEYKIISAAGSGYKTVQILEEYVDYYLHESN